MLFKKIAMLIGAGALAIGLTACNPHAIQASGHIFAYQCTPDGYDVQVSLGQNVKQEYLVILETNVPELPATIFSGHFSTGDEHSTTVYEHTGSLTSGYFRLSIVSASFHLLYQETAYLPTSPLAPCEA